MKIAIVYGAVSVEAPPDEQDALVQVHAVSGALARLGHDPVPVSAGLDLEALAATLRDLRPACVFNLVEGLAGRGSLIHLVPSLLDGLDIPYTGARGPAMLLTSHKLLAKTWLRSHGLPTPDWIAPDRTDLPQADLYILKSVWEHASIGLDDDALVRAESLSGLQEALVRHGNALGGEVFAEVFVPGREFNLALLASPREPEVLPPAEISFAAFPPGKPRIVGYRAKWEEESFEYRHTPRCFAFPPEDGGLLAALQSLAEACWRLFDLRGYARVDFRVDAAGRPWILEVNANPCLSPDGGFAAAAERAGMAFDEVVKRILRAR